MTHRTASAHLWVGGPGYDIPGTYQLGDAAPTWALRW